MNSIGTGWELACAVVYQASSEGWMPCPAPRHVTSVNYGAAAGRRAE